MKRKDRTKGEKRNREKSRRNTFGLIAALTLPVGLLLVVANVFALAQDSKPNAPNKPLTAKQKYKNIRVLQDLPAAQLMPEMHRYNAALNVQCSFCHTVDAQRNAWDKDDNPMKTVARQMIGVVNDLNAHQKSLNGQATCYMCHHGHPEPVTSIPPQAPPANR